MKTLALSLLLAVSLFSTGCVSYLATASHNSKLDREALRMELRSLASGETEGSVSFDLLGARGYTGAWKESPKLMAGATLTDLLLAAGTYLVYEELDDNGGSGPATVTPSVALEGAQASVINVQIIDGSGNSASGGSSAPAE